MQYRTLGKTGLKVSILGMGCMRLPVTIEKNKAVIREEEAIRVIRRAIDGGVNYVDSAYRYHNSKSEIVLGKALKDGYREKVFIETKLYSPGIKTADDFDRLLDEQLKKLDVDYIDVYLIHGLSLERYRKVITKFNVVEKMQKAKEDGIIRHIGFSSHDTPENIKEIIDTGFFEVMLVQYNILHRNNHDVIQYAADKGLGVVLMGPNAGGRLGLEPSESMSNLLTSGRKNFIDLGLKFVWSHPGVSIALSGMGSEEMVRDNLELASQNKITLNKDEKLRVDKLAQGYKQIADIGCTQCGYCEPCDEEVRIKHIMELLMHSVGSAGYWEAAKNQYKAIGISKKYPGKNAEVCVECGICETRCPEEIPIIDRLKQTHKLLTGLDSYNT